MRRSAGCRPATAPASRLVGPRLQRRAKSIRARCAPRGRHRRLRRGQPGVAQREVHGVVALPAGEHPHGRAAREAAATRPTPPLEQGVPAGRDAGEVGRRRAGREPHRRARRQPEEVEQPRPATSSPRPSPASPVALRRSGPRRSPASRRREQRGASRRSRSRRTGRTASRRVPARTPTPAGRRPPRRPWAPRAGRRPSASATASAPTCGGTGRVSRLSSQLVAWSCARLRTCSCSLMGPVFGRERPATTPRTSLFAWEPCTSRSEDGCEPSSRRSRCSSSPRLRSRTAT